MAGLSPTPLSFRSSLYISVACASGTTKLERLEENLTSVDVEFTPKEWRDLNHAVSKIKLQGDRYPTDQEKLVGH